MKLLVFIPAHNEEANIKKVADDLRNNAPFADFVVIDDGSSDSTSSVCSQYNIPCITLPVNLGLDGVIRTGCRYAYDSGYDCCLQFDGDGQHQAKYIEPMLKKMEDGYDIVIGSRFVEKRRGRSLRMIGSRLIGALIKLTTGCVFTDPTSGMRMVNRKLMKRIAEDRNCGAESDTYAYFVKNGAKFSDVQVEMSEREAGESYLTFGKSIIYMARILAAITLINWFRKGDSRN